MAFYRRLGPVRPQSFEDKFQKGIVLLLICLWVLCFSLILWINKSRSQDVHSSFENSMVKTFITIADPHLNLSYNGTSPYGEIGLDSTSLLYNDTLQHARKNIPSLGMFLFLGDNVVHSWKGDSFKGPLSEGETLDVIDESLGMLGKYFRKQDFEYGGITTVFGNADVAPDYAEGVEDEEMLAYIGELVDRMDLRQNYTQEEIEVLKRMSCNQIPLNEHLDVIVINTIYYSPIHNNGSAKSLDPMGQFKCLVDALTNSQNENKRVYIIGHIPPICSSFDGAQQWQQHYAEQYAEIILEFRDVIAAQFFGHTHRNEYRVPKPDGACPDCPPIIIFGGVSPMFGNNPSFSFWDIDIFSGEVVKIISYYTPLKPGLESLSWFRLIDTFNDLGLESLSTPNLQNLSSVMFKDLEKEIGEQYSVTKYLTMVNSNSGVSLDPIIRRWYVCSSYWFLSEKEFSDCVVLSKDASLQYMSLANEGPIGDHLLDLSRRRALYSKMPSG